MLVKVIGIDRATGKIRLSRKEALGKTPDVVHNFRAARRFVRPGSSDVTAPRVRFQRLRPGAQAPRYMSAGAAGLDLVVGRRRADQSRPAGARRGATGLAFAIPPGFEGQVRPRSGLARKYGVTVPNAPGTIDSDYRGEVQVLLVNLGAEPLRRQPGRPHRAARDRAGRDRGAGRGGVPGRQRPRRRRLRPHRASR